MDSSKTISWTWNALYAIESLVGMDSSKTLYGMYSFILRIESLVEADTSKAIDYYEEETKWASKK